MPNADLVVVCASDTPAVGCGSVLLRIQEALPGFRVGRVAANDFSLISRKPAPRLVVVEDAMAPATEAILDRVKKLWPGASAVGLIEAREPSAERIAELMNAGLDDFICHPIHYGELRYRVQRLIPADRGPSRAEEWKRSLNLEAMVGESRRFLESMRRIPLLAATDASVLVYGETGTGKEMFAHALHYCSPRKAGPFVPVNCGALPEHLLENELFGHARGAYTDAGSNERGLLAVAEGGTLFLDEADGLSLRAQVKLLRFLQNREYRPLGSTRNLVADVRIVAAANQDLRKLVEAGQMREDLYHRLNILRIQIPPLRERPDDVFLLADHFLARYRVQYRRPLLKWSPAALSALSRYDWPGNIRELEGVVLRAVVLAAENTIEPPDLDLPDVTEPASEALASFHQAKTNAIQRFERAYLTDLLGRFAGNVSRAAEAAGKERRSFQRLLQKHGVTRAGVFGNRTKSA